MKDLKLPSVTKKELKKIRKKVFKVRGARILASILRCLRMLDDRQQTKTVPAR